jgi:hypothetical protein
VLGDRGDLRHWSVGGSTSLDNTVLICSYHHGELHRRAGWTVFLAAD